MNKLLIPKTIHVGYQTRKDTYTGKLAYVIYTDDKGKKRKEKSWNSWRDDEIEPNDFTNEPTSGFVLNKGVGGVKESHGWDVRNEYIRVYDPRGHEFEISVANLLFILQECSSIKGKGLEGEFVYAWDGTELVLLPTSCTEYKTSSNFTSLQSMKVTAKDMVEGGTYQDKQTNELVYLGRQLCRYSTGYYGVKFILHLPPSTKKHIFYNTKNKEFEFHSGFTKLAKVISLNCYFDYANIFTKFQNSEYVSAYKGVKLVPCTIPDCSKYRCKLLLKYKETYRIVKLFPGYYNSYNRYNNISTSPFFNQRNLDSLTWKYTYDNYNQYSYMNYADILKKIPNPEFYKLQFELESGHTIGAYGYEQ